MNITSITTYDALDQILITDIVCKFLCVLGILMAGPVTLSHFASFWLYRLTAGLITCYLTMQSHNEDD